MVLVISIFFWLVAFIYAHKLEVLNKASFWFNLFIVFLLAFLGIVELEIFSADNWFSRLDEQTFVDWGQLPMSEISPKNHRYFLYILLTHLTLKTGGGLLALKLQCTSFAVLSSLVIFDATRRKDSLWLFPILFSFLFFFSSLVMRDMIIIFVTLWLCLWISRLSIFYLPVWAILGWCFYFHIRPEAGLFFLFALVWYVFHKVSRLGFIFTYCLPTAIAFIIFVTPLVDYIIEILRFFYTERIDLYVYQRSEAIKIIPFFSDNFTAVLRQLFTPFPVSKLIDILKNGGGENLFIYELLRMHMLVVFYFLIFYCLAKWRSVLKVLSKNDFLKLLFGITVAYTLAYSLHSDGGGDTRNKVYPYLLLFIVFLMTSNPISITFSRAQAIGRS